VVGPVIMACEDPSGPDQHCPDLDVRLALGVFMAPVKKDRVEPPAVPGQLPGNLQRGTDLERDPSPRQGMNPLDRRRAYCFQPLSPQRSQGNIIDRRHLARLHEAGCGDQQRLARIHAHLGVRPDNN